MDAGRSEPRRGPSPIQQHSVLPRQWGLEVPISAPRTPSVFLSDCMEQGDVNQQFSSVCTQPPEQCLLFLRACNISLSVVTDTNCATVLHKPGSVCTQHCQGGKVQKISAFKRGFFFQCTSMVVTLCSHYPRGICHYSSGQYSNWQRYCKLCAINLSNGSKVASHYKSPNCWSRTSYEKL